MTKVTDHIRLRRIAHLLDTALAAADHLQDPASKRGVLSRLAAAKAMVTKRAAADDSTGKGAASEQVRYYVRSKQNCWRRVGPADSPREAVRDAVLDLHPIPPCDLIITRCITQHDVELGEVHVYVVRAPEWVDEVHAHEVTE